MTKKTPNGVTGGVKAAKCESCGHPMSARSDDALALAIGEHFIGVWRCQQAWVALVEKGKVA
jgi:hypothetical protein